MDRPDDPDVLLRYAHELKDTEIAALVGKLNEVIDEESATRLQNLPDGLKQLIQLHALFELLKLLSFPKELLPITSEQDHRDLYDQFDDFAICLKSEFWELVSSMKNWRSRLLQKGNSI